MRRLWATSLKQSVREQLPGLCLSGSEELMCHDPVCMRFGELCLCRLSMQLQRLQHVRHLDMRRAGLDRLPEVWKLSQLETLDVSENKLETLPSELTTMPTLRWLGADSNPLPGEAFEPFRHLLQVPRPEEAHMPPESCSGD